jgi:single-strand DNA-binding protein
MAGETTITVIGNLTSDPELRFTTSGQAVCNFTVASTPRTFDRDTQEWKDGETLFLRANVWREAAEHAQESLAKGMRVIVAGKLKSRTFDTKEGDRRTVFEIDVEELGPSLRSATAVVTRQRKDGGTRTAAAAASEPGWGWNDAAGTAEPARQAADPPF